MRKNKGFTLIELLVVLMIILIFLAVGFPHVLKFLRNDHAVVEHKPPAIEQPLELDEGDKNL